MKLQRFFIDWPVEHGAREITSSDAELIHQLKSVFRFRTGDQAVILDGSGKEYVSEITLFEKDSVTFAIRETRENKNLPKKELYLFQALIKKDKLEWVVEKGTELGVAAFVPVLADRSEKKAFNPERIYKIIKEASEQSARGTLPHLDDAIGSDEVAALEKGTIELYAFHTDISGAVSFEKCEALHKAKKLGILIGPEGGWSEREIELFKKHSIPLVHLGASGQVLRAETAAIAAIAKILL